MKPQFQLLSECKPKASRGLFNSCKRRRFVVRGGGMIRLKRHGAEGASLPGARENFGFLESLKRYTSRILRRIF